jgi:lysophospholipase L1-like esterase
MSARAPRLTARALALLRAVAGLSFALTLLILMEGALRFAGFHYGAGTLTIENQFNPAATMTMPKSRAAALAGSVSKNMVWNPLTIPDPDLLFRVLPAPPGGRLGSYDGINAHGFRGRDPDGAASGSQARRVLVLGDSVAFGWGLTEVDTTFPAALERDLAAGGDQWEVYNLAQPGYSTTQGRLLYERWVARIEPHAVVLSFGWNDVWPTPWLTDSKAIALFRVHNSATARRLRELRLYQAVERVLDALRPVEPARPGPGDTEASDRVGPAESLANLATMIEGRPAVILLPGYDPTAAEPYEPGRIARFNARTREALGARAALVWPEAMEPSSPGVAQYYQEDGFHPNARGAELLAREVARALRERMALEGRACPERTHPSADQNRMPRPGRSRCS